MLHARGARRRGSGEIPLSVDYEGRRFRAVGHGPEATVATYHQDGDLLWADFAGGSARRGAVCGRVAPDGTVDFAYTMVLATGEIIAGRCHSTPERLADGRIRLHEEWERFAPHASTGTSEIEELPSD
jgi:hypothetical protein